MIDDPFGDRDGPKWRLFLKAVPEYDLITVVREPNVQEAYERGATDVLRVYRSADEVVHAPLELSQEEEEKWSSEVTFVGTWFPERGPFMKRLIERGVPLTIRGNSWQKADEWNTIKPYWESPAVYGDDYTKALQCADICLGLLSKGNRDRHTQRSLEIPYIGSLLCAERTKEHQHLYKEGREAVFWDDAEECAELCFDLLSDKQRREEIAARGRRHCIENGYLNEKVMNRLIEHF
ncbi:CgeB family protein [Salinibacter sp.]|uniref:CgeB family protein n=1 Tax=Salinibacter sp. TaxID=2065818 RepID=UPI0021E90321|nr:glycosyltransferase [Salinibacter sp.]